jgi:hypothetical protein
MGSSRLKLRSSSLPLLNLKKFSPLKLLQSKVRAGLGWDMTQEQRCAKIIKDQIKINLKSF